MRGLNAKAKRQAQEDSRPASVSSGRPQAPDEYKKRILEVVRQLLRGGKFEEATMSQIAKQAGIGQGSLYRRYAHKGEICSELLNQSAERLLAELEDQAKAAGAEAEGASPGTVKGQPEPASGAIMAQLETAIRKIIDYVDENVELLGVINQGFSGKNQLTQFEHSFFQRLIKLLVVLLSRAAEQGEIDRLNPAFTANALMAVLSPDVYLYQRKHHQATKEEITDGVLRIFVQGLSR